MVDCIVVCSHTARNSDFWPSFGRALPHLGSCQLKSIGHSLNVPYGGTSDFRMSEPSLYQRDADKIYNKEFGRFLNLSIPTESSSNTGRCQAFGLKKHAGTGKVYPTKLGIHITRSARVGLLSASFCRDSPLRQLAAWLQCGEAVGEVPCSRRELSGMC
jgi:hypothetical protein